MSQASSDVGRIFGAHAADLLSCGLRYSLTHGRMRSLRCSAAPGISATCTPNLSANPPEAWLIGS